MKYQCPICGYKFDIESWILDSDLKYRPELIQCPYCEHVFDKKQLIKLRRKG